jgi:aldehyde dehydrogenase (NAD+)
VTTDALQGESRLLIGGKLVESSSGKTFDNINPATEEVIGVTSDATPDDMRTAIAAARQAADETTWADDAAFRKSCLLQLETALRNHAEEFRPVVVAEAGCPVMLTYAIQLDWTFDDLAYWADQADRYEYETWLPERDVMGARPRRMVRREPIGVVGAITPWNFPVYLNLAKLGPALASGNTVVLKPAPDTPWEATMIGRLIAEETDIPPGVVNVVASSDHLVGEVLSTDPRVDMITFTGSTATGRRIMAKGAETVKRVFLELGGKSPNIILDDHPDFAGAMAGAGGICMHAGQGCAIATRMLLPRSRYDEGVEIAKGAFENVSYGDPTDMSVFMGPQISKLQQERVQAYIEKGKSEARLVTGGGKSKMEKGYFVEPTLFADVDPMATIAQEEIFGPVLVLIPYEDDDDAVRIANSTIYGLSGSISGGSEDRALAMAKRVKSGTLSVNGAQWFAPDTPFGGYRQSGQGRENGTQGFEEYLETKVIGLPGKS